MILIFFSDCTAFVVGVRIYFFFLEKYNSRGCYKGLQRFFCMQRFFMDLPK